MIAGFYERNFWVAVRIKQWDGMNLLKWNVHEVHQEITGLVNENEAIITKPTLCWYHVNTPG